MVTFFICLAVLILGYVIYGKVVTKVFMPDNRETPALTVNDGVDYIPMKMWRVFLIHSLNIAGTGPIFGALMGAVFGPIVFVWIVLGSILGGAVHDYFSGMISGRMKGAMLSEIIGTYLGKGAKVCMSIFCIALSILVGAIFTTSPAELLAVLTPEFLDKNFWMIIILLYYLLATFLPIDKIIGKIYPIFGIAIMVMAFGIVGGLLMGGYHIPELTLNNLHPNNIPAFPFMCITVACGAISGFHATQSPMMTRCIQSEKDGRKVFYGAMIAEAIIALIWATAGVAFYEGTQALQNALNDLGQSGVVYEISQELLGPIGGVLAIIGVVACPITTGDTALRMVRLTVADLLKLDQSKIYIRAILSVAVLGCVVAVTVVDFQIIWRYCSWSNQTLSVLSLWAFSIYIAMNAKKKIYSLITALPATFMSIVSVTYILMADEGFKLSGMISYPIGIVFSVLCLGLFIYKGILKTENLKAYKDKLTA